MINIYILKLEENKYYIGKTNNINIRINDHVTGNGSEWTKKYKPIEIIEIIENCDDFDEDKYTKIYMNKFGIDNVRGGSYSRIVLSKEEINLIQKEIIGSTDKCYKCNKSGHFSKECHLPINSTIPTDPNCQHTLPNKNNSIFNIFSSVIKTLSNIILECDDYDDSDKNVCYRCGRNTHFVRNCYASTHINGYKLK